MTKQTTMSEKSLDLGNADKNVDAFAKEVKKSGKGDASGGGMTSKDVIGMASSKVAAVAASASGPSGTDLSAWGKATSKVPAIAASAKKSGKGD